MRLNAFEANVNIHTPESADAFVVVVVIIIIVTTPSPTMCHNPAFYGSILMMRSVHTLIC